MTIPSSFINKIENVFNDKLVEILSVSQNIDEEGWAGDRSSTKVSDFYANVSFQDLKILQEDQGLKEEVSIAITTGTGNSVSVGSILEYDDVTYRVISSIPYDSHNLILGSKWLSKSSVLTSA